MGIRGLITLIINTMIIFGHDLSHPARSTKAQYLVSRDTHMDKGITLADLE